MRHRSAKVVLVVGLAVAVAAAAAVGLAVRDTTTDGAPEGAEAAGWTRAASMSQRRSYVAGAAAAGRFYAAGGMVGQTGRPLATFASFDPAADRWTVLPQMPVPTRAAAGAALDDRLIVVAGGWTTSGATRSVWGYDIARRRWSALAPLPAARVNLQLVTAGGSVYAIGGYDARGERRTVWRLAPSGERWLPAPPLPVPVHAFAAAAFAGRVWVVGGRRDDTVLRETWTLAPGARTWEPGPPLAHALELAGAAVGHDGLHVVTESSHQVLDHEAGSWRRAAPLRVPRHALLLFATGNALYAVGGCTTALQDSAVVERLPLAAPAEDAAAVGAAP